MSRKVLSGLMMAVLFTRVGLCQCPQDPGDYFDQVLASYMGVEARSNGDRTANGFCSLTEAPHQCLVYVQRFFQSVYSQSFPHSVGTAENMYEYARDDYPTEFFAYPNHGDLPPLTGDILCFDGAGVGHVAIVTKVDLKDGSIGIIEQNWNRTRGTRNLTITKNADKTYSVTFPSTQGYYVEGWVRAKSMVVGRYENEPAWQAQTSQAIAEAYNRNGGLATLRNPHDDGAGVYIHLWQPGTHDFLIQNLGDGSWGPCALVMWPTWDKAYPLHGAFWWYFWYYNVLDGLPVSDEYRSGNNVYQDFENGKTYHWDLTWSSDHPVEVLNTADVHAQVHISLTPSFTAYALSDTQAYVSSGPVSGGVTYRVLRNGTQAGTLGASYSPITNYPHQLQAASQPLTS